MGIFKSKTQEDADVRYPLRDRFDYLKTFGYLVFLPAFVTVLCSYFLLDRILIQPYLGAYSDSSVHIDQMLKHYGWLMAVLGLLWVPQILAIIDFPNAVESVIGVARDILLVIVAYCNMPHFLLLRLADVEWTAASPPLWYWIVFSSVSALFVLAGFINSQHGISEFRKVREGGKPDFSKSPMLSKTASIAGTLIFFIILFIIELKYVAKHHVPHSENVWMDFFLLGTRSPEWPYFSVSVFLALFPATIAFLTAVLPNRLMYAVLMAATFKQPEIRGLVGKSYRYFYHFLRSLILRTPMFPYLFFLSLLYFFLIFFFAHSSRTGELNYALQPDFLVLFLAVSSVWFVPMIFSLVHPDETFGTYFFLVLEQHLIRVQKHKLYMGFGDLGQRAVNRELIVELEKTTNAKISRWFSRRKAKKMYFTDIVTPDVQLEKMALRIVIVEKDRRKVAYSATSQLQGEYGAVEALQRQIITRDAKKNRIKAFTRILVPTIIGDAAEAFTMSRANIDRAEQIISTVADAEKVQTIYRQAYETDTAAIIVVPRSDQIAYYTYQTRHKKIATIYPEHARGITLGFHLLGMCRKLMALEKNENHHETGPVGLKKKKGRAEKAPKILFVGNNKSNQYILETLWSHFLLDPKERDDFFSKNLAYLVVDEKQQYMYPRLKDNLPIPENEVSVFDKFTPSFFISGARYPEHVADNIKFYNIPVRIINGRDIAAVEAVLENFTPDIIVLFHNNREHQPWLLARIVRALERIKNRMQKAFPLPMMMLTSSSGDIVETVTLGDAMRFYNAMCMTNADMRPANSSYPVHSFFNRFSKELIGESISDALSDPEEVIVGASSSLERMASPDKKHALSKYVEINACYPNRPGGLADLLARLAGLDFRYAPEEKKKTLCTEEKKVKYFCGKELERVWQDGNKEIKYGAVESGGIKTDLFLPSFQYLQSMTLNYEQKGFIVSGYAALVPITSREYDTLFLQRDQKMQPVIKRIFSTDGQKYIDDKFDETQLISWAFSENYFDAYKQHYKEPKQPGVPEILAQATGLYSEKEQHEQDTAARNKDEKDDQRKTPRVEPSTTIEEFYRTLYGKLPSQKGGEEAKKMACPGMNGCRIAAFQDWVVASNDIRLRDYVQNPEKNSLPLMHARNYHCCSDIRETNADLLPQKHSHFARIFCCSDGVYQPGLLAMIFNAFVFRLEHQHLENHDWAINLSYFMDVNCKNRFYSLSRIFGNIVTKSKSGVGPGKDQIKDGRVPLPVHLIRILPIGDVESRKHWFAYARALWAFLNEYHKEIGVKKEYRFFWTGKNRRKYSASKYGQPGGQNKDEAYPAWTGDSIPDVIVIKRYDEGREIYHHVDYDDEKKFPSNGPQRDPKKCLLCGIQPREHDCSKFRVWI